MKPPAILLRRLPLAPLAAALLLCSCRSGAERPTAAVAPAPASASRVVLLTGFEPFDGGAVNASWEAVRDFDGREVAGCRVVARCLPVVWGEPLKLLPGLFDEHRPAAVFCLGQGRAGRFTFEHVGRNERKQYSDNRGRRPEQPTVVLGGPPQLLSPFPIDAVLPGLRRSGLPVITSENAGQYLCDETTYSLESLRRGRGGFACAFFHVPPLGSKLQVSGQEVVCDRELLRGFVRSLIESWAALPRENAKRD